jgi:hypothetical protein
MKYTTTVILGKELSEMMEKVNDGGIFGTLQAFQGKKLCCNCDDTKYIACFSRDRYKYDAFIGWHRDCGRKSYEQRKQRPIISVDEMTYTRCKEIKIVSCFIKSSKLLADFTGSVETV